MSNDGVFGLTVCLALVFALFVSASVCLIASIKDTLSPLSTNPPPATIFISAAGVAMNAIASVMIVYKLLGMLP